METENPTRWNADHIPRALSVAGLALVLTVFIRTVAVLIQGKFDLGWSNAELSDFILPRNLAALAFSALLSFLILTPGFAPRKEEDETARFSRELALLLRIFVALLLIAGFIAFGMELGEGYAIQSPASDLLVFIAPPLLAVYAYASFRRGTAFLRLWSVGAGVAFLLGPFLMKIAAGPEYTSGYLLHPLRTLLEVSPRFNDVGCFTMSIVGALAGEIFAGMNTVSGTGDVLSVTPELVRSNSRAQAPTPAGLPLENHRRVGEVHEPSPPIDAPTPTHVPSPPAPQPRRSGIFDDVR